VGAAVERAPNRGCKTDAVYPASAAIVAGVFIRPTSLLAVRLDYGRLRQVNDLGSVCQNLDVGGKTTSPVTYGCQNLVIGEPTWSTKTALRAEYRQYVAHGVGVNPSFTFAWAGPEAAPFGAKKGSWVIDVPLYLKLKASDLGGAPAPKKEDEAKKDDPKKDSADLGTLAIGIALSHRQTWGLGAKDQTSDDVSVFLGGVFDLTIH
jgi:hypothetical protein